MSSVSNQQYSQGNLPDAVLKVQGVEFEIHKFILGHWSEYFKALFLRWSKPNQREYTVSDITPEIMALILQFAYTSYLPVTVNNVQALMIAADRYNIMAIVQTCSLFLEEQLNPATCIGIWQFTKIYYSPELHLKAYYYILNHFQDVVLGEEWLNVTVEELAELLEGNNDNMAFEAMMRWIADKPEERKDYLYTLM